MSVVEDGRQLLQRLAAEQTLSHAQCVLADAGLCAVVLKGAWLLAEVYAAADLRPITDVDLLVARADFDAACEAFMDKGFACIGGDARQRVFRHPQLSLDIDLHHALFPAGTFELSAHQLLARPRPSPLAALKWPDPLDGFAHLVGHFALNRLVSNNLQRRRDFELIARCFDLSPKLAAQHLHDHGLGRAARYTFELLNSSANSELRNDDFCQQVRRALPTDRLGDRLAHVCAAVVPRLPAEQRLGAVMSCLLEPTLVRALVSALRRPFSALRYAAGRDKQFYSPQARS